MSIQKYLPSYSIANYILTKEEISNLEISSLVQILEAMAGLQVNLNLGDEIDTDRRVKHSVTLRLLNYLKLKENDPNIIRMSPNLMSPNKSLPDMNFTWEKVLDDQGNWSWPDVKLISTQDYPPTD